ncbi:MAG TPA: DNA-formamidopyrimidine glycosylase family protein [Vicinamibacterales bacterium]
MPEIPDVELYVHALRQRLPGQRLTEVRLRNPFLLRTVDPPLSAFTGTRVVDVHRIAKRIAIGFEEERFLVLHLMIAGRLHWSDAGDRKGRAKALAELRFEHGTLTFTEAGSTRRASLHAVAGRAGLAAHTPPGVDALTADLDAFRDALRRENHTLKRALTDQRLIAGIGNAYSDELLHRARLSPMKLTSKLTDEEIARLHDATVTVLREWIARLQEESGDAFPERVTAFRPEMAVHGRFGQPCPVCGAPVQRIVYASNECNYCARCQTDGRLLADRALSRLLKEDWPKTLDD